MYELTMYDAFIRKDSTQELSRKADSAFGNIGNTCVVIRKEKRKIFVLERKKKI